MHGKTLLGLATAIALTLFLCFSIAGCAKKKPAEAKMPQTTQLSKQIPGADTSDVFKEFYSEDTAKKKAAAAPKKSAKQETFSTASAAEFSENGRYTVQVSCVKSQSFANSMVSKLKDKGYPAYVAEVQNPTPNLSGTFYRVRIGGFDKVANAKSFGENTLIANGYEYWVDKKSNDNVGMEGYGLGSGSAGSSAAGSYNAASPPTQPSTQPSSSFGSSSSTESSFGSSTSSGTSGSSSFGSSSPGTTGSSSFESSPSSGTGTTGSSSFGSSSSSFESSGSSSTTPSSSGTTSGSSTSSGFGSSGSSTSSTPSSSSSSTPSSSGSSFGSTPSSSGTGATGGAKDTSGGW
ncbi:MAG TPA: SPOR domain-containing protein [Chitinivibrionales bacterium]|nr:SPOR domain-containing protein [Chitinivibrionales bacterium]